MSINEIASKVAELRELRRMAEELQSEIDTITDAIKEHMTAHDTDEISGTDYKITWKPVTRSTIDGAALKKELPEIAARYTKTTTSRRFNVA